MLIIVLFLIFIVFVLGGIFLTNKHKEKMVKLKVSLDKPIYVCPCCSKKINIKEEGEDEIPKPWKFKEYGENEE